LSLVLLGADGQLGRALRAAATGRTLIPLTHSELDLTIPGQVRDTLRSLHPQWIINAAAYTAVDQAESDPAAAFAVNRDGPASLAKTAREIGARLIHLSTDYVFDGQQSRPYRPQDTAAPLNVYGQSKLEGERALFDILGDNALVLRTSWLYAATGKNFFLSMMQLLSAPAPVHVVADQIGTPTYVEGLAQAILRALDVGVSGLHHWTDAGVASWYDFAVAVREEAVAIGCLPETAAEVRPIVSSDLRRPAARPAYSVLDKTATWSALGQISPHWRAQLRRALKTLKSERVR
jgi:dTDP-4-dehydrorhamnose reductase